MGAMRVACEAILRIPYFVLLEHLTAVTFFAVHGQNVEDLGHLLCSSFCYSFKGICHELDWFM